MLLLLTIGAVAGGSAPPPSRPQPGSTRRSSDPGRTFAPHEHIARRIEKATDSIRII
jgi:hypothetical protein